MSPRWQVTGWKISVIYSASIDIEWQPHRLTERESEWVPDVKCIHPAHQTACLWRGQYFKRLTQSDQVKRCPGKQRKSSYTGDSVQLTAGEMHEWLSQIIPSINKQRCNLPPSLSLSLSPSADGKRVSSQGLIIFSSGNNHFSSLYPFCLPCCALLERSHCSWAVCQCISLALSLSLSPSPVTS